jgi:serine/threonine-protein kinase
VGVALLAGRFEVRERIGGGAMADVFLAHDVVLGHDVALKQLRPIHLGKPDLLARFRHEAQALAAIDHPGIVRVLHWGMNPEGPYIAMELVRGGTLRDFMNSRGRVDERTAAAIVAEIAGALEAAHTRGVLHRDLKPENILLDHDKRPKLGDFGIARLAAATALTQAGVLLGTPQYLSPEQLRGGVVDERADVFALGVILFELLTGVPPTTGATASEVVARRLRFDPPPPHRLIAITPELEAVVMRALAREPARRFARAAHLRDALLPIAAETDARAVLAEPKVRRRLRIAALAVAGALVIAYVAVPRSESPKVLFGSEPAAAADTIDTAGSTDEPELTATDMPTPEEVPAPKEVPAPASIEQPPVASTAPAPALPPSVVPRTQTPRTEAVVRAIETDSSAPSSVSPAPIQPTPSPTPLLPIVPAPSTSPLPTVPTLPTLPPLP